MEALATIVTIGLTRYATIETLTLHSENGLAEPNSTSTCLDAIVTLQALFNCHFVVNSAVTQNMSDKATNSVESSPIRTEENGSVSAATAK